jgi:hypothetical protein
MSHGMLLLLVRLVLCSTTVTATLWLWLCSLMSTMLFCPTTKGSGEACKHVCTRQNDLESNLTSPWQNVIYQGTRDLNKQVEALLLWAGKMGLTEQQVSC